MNVYRCPKCNHKLFDVQRSSGSVTLRFRCRYCKEFVSFTVASEPIEPERTVGA